jgi:hypothetical protein
LDSWVFLQGFGFLGVFTSSKEEAMRQLVAICFCPNGVKADDPSRLDAFSMAGLNLAAKLWRQEGGVFVINYDIPITPGGERMGEVTVRELHKAGITQFEISDRRTFNAITVVRSHAEHCLARGRTSKLVVSGSEIVSYFQAVARGVEKAYEPGWQWEVVAPNNGPKANEISTRLYRVLAPITEAAAVTGFTFRAYAMVRNWWDRRRLNRPFVGTLCQ